MTLKPESMHSEATKAGRARLAGEVMGLAQAYNWVANCEDSGQRKTRVYLCGPRGLSTTVEIDGDKHPSELDHFCLAWNIHFSSDARLSSSMETATGATVNPYHSRKCTAFADGYDALISQLRKVMRLAESGEAFSA